MTTLCSIFRGDGLRLELIFKAHDPAVNPARVEALYAKSDQFEKQLGESAV